ncbi:unnamed protein product [Lupinus luteus]|uniref:HORMA domain-containing protein n=1 Tax=Lupinus luteus TaxID=3873 RepID=A0AAV1Y5M6_LUPLU
MVVAQKVKEAEITEQDSLLLVLIYEMKIKKLMPLDAESRRLIDWMEKGTFSVYDALQNKYLKTILFCVCEAVDGPMIEEYAFQLMRTLEKMPEEVTKSKCLLVKIKTTLFTLHSSYMRCKNLPLLFTQRTILMKLLYYDNVTPADYEPPFFRGCTEEEAYHPWSKNPLKMEVGNVNSKHFVLALKVKSVLDPCEDDNEGIEDDMNTCNDSMQDEYDDTDSEVDHSQGDQYVVAPIGKQLAPEDNSLTNEDNTQDPVENEQQMARVKEWINCCHLGTIELTGILSNFPDISVALIEGIKKSEYEFTIMKEAIDGQAPQVFDRPLQTEDLIYMKALYHALPMTYVSVSKLQSLLEGEVNLTAARRIIDKMTRDGFLEPKGSKRLGKRVIHSELTERKFIDVQKALSTTEAMDVDRCEPNSKPKQAGFRINGSNYDLSTYGALHSIGSDLTRMKVTSETNYTDSMKSGQKVLKAKDNGNTPTSKPVDSRESFAQGKENNRANGNSTPNQKGEADTNILSSSSQDKRPRKISAVKDPIHQNVKRQRAQTPQL